MDQQTGRKTYNTDQEQLRPTPAHERALEDTLWRCRALYTAALPPRLTASQRRQASLSRNAQEAERKTSRAALPDDAALHSHLLPRRSCPAGSDLPSVLPSHPTGRAGGLPTLQGQESLALLRLHGGWRRRAAGPWDPHPRHEWAHQRALEPSACGHAQDPHALARGGWLVGGDL